MKHHRPAVSTEGGEEMRIAEMRNTEHRMQKPKTEMYRFHPSLN